MLFDKLRKATPTFDEINERNALKGLLNEAYKITDAYLASLDMAIYDAPQDGEDPRVKVIANTDQFKAALDELVGSYAKRRDEFAKKGAAISDEVLKRKKEVRMQGKPAPTAKASPKHTPPKIRTREDAIGVFKQVATTMFPGEREEIAIYKMSQTDQGREMATAIQQFPQGPPSGATPPVEKREAPRAEQAVTSAGGELAREADKIAKSEGISQELAMGRAAQRRPDLLGKHNEELRPGS